MRDQNKEAKCLIPFPASTTISSLWWHCLRSIIQTLFLIQIVSHFTTLRSGSWNQYSSSSLGCVVVGFGKIQKQRVGSLAKSYSLSCESHLAVLGRGASREESVICVLLWSPDTFWRMRDLSVNESQVHRCKGPKLLWAPQFYLPHRDSHSAIAP